MLTTQTAAEHSDNLATVRPVQFYNWLYKPETLWDPTYIYNKTMYDTLLFTFILKNCVTSLMIVGYWPKHVAVVINTVVLDWPTISESCHHGMARPHAADGWTVSNMEGRSEYIE